MKTINLRFATWCLVSLCLLISCQDDELPTGGVTINEGKDLVFERSGEPQVIHIETELPWKIELEGEWLKTIETAGDGVTDLKIYADQSYEENDRRGIIRITPQGRQATEIKVSQKGINSSDDNTELSAEDIIGYGYYLTGVYPNIKDIKKQVFNYKMVVDAFKGNYESRYLINSTQKDTTGIDLIKEIVGREVPFYFGNVSYPGSFSSFDNAIRSSFLGNKEEADSVRNYRKELLAREYRIRVQQKGISYFSQFRYDYAFLTEDFKAAADAIIAHPTGTDRRGHMHFDKKYMYDLFDQFGTAIIDKISLGGTLSYAMTVPKTDSQVVKFAELSVGWKNMFNLPLDETEEYVSDNELGKNYYERLIVRGGDSQLLSKAIEGKRGQCSPLDIDNWIKSITIKPELNEISLERMCDFIRSYLDHRLGYYEYGLYNDLDDAIRHYTESHLPK